MNQKELIVLKQKIKSKQPEFLRDGYNNLLRLSDKVWRKPKGIHSKLRHGFAGHRNRVEPGYGTPAELRGIGKEGLLPILIHNTKELEKIENKKQGAIIASIGIKNKIELIKKAQEKNITILNIKDTKQFITKIEENLKKRKDAKKTKKEKAQSREKETEKKAKTETKQIQTDETKKEQEKKELDKILTKKDA